MQGRRQGSIQGKFRMDFSIRFPALGLGNLTRWFVSRSTEGKAKRDLIE